MKKKRFLTKIFAGVALTLTVSVSAVFGGCFGASGRDGVNGKDLNIYDVYEAAKEQTGNPDLTFDQFLKTYFSYTTSDLEEQIGLQKAINRSLLSGVSIRSSFRESMGSTLASYAGSGVILDIDKEKGDMTVLTNCHVVYSRKATYVLGQDGFSDRISLWLYGSEYSSDMAIEATIMATSKAYDLAVLKVTNSSVVKSSHAIAASWAAGEESYLGETVYAIGNANGNKMSANVGYISKDVERVTVNFGTDTDKEFYSNQVLRTSAAINSGNSGGGLYNAAGELVGIVNSKSKSADMSGVGYALTASSSQRVVKRMLRGYDGTENHFLKIVNHHINFDEDKSGYTTGLNENGFAEIREDVVVTSVISGKAMGKIKRNDVIKHIKVTHAKDGTVDEADINRYHNFDDIMLAVEPGDTVEFTVDRGGEQYEKVQVVFTESDFVNSDDIYRVD